MKPLLVLTIVLLGFTSCKKNQLTETDPINTSKPEYRWEATIGASPHLNAVTIFKESESELKEIIATKDTIRQKRLTLQLANNIASYVYKTQKVDIRKEFINDPNGIVFLGMLLEIKERSLTPSSKSTNSPSDLYAISTPEMDCFFAAVGGLVGINEAKTMWLTLMGEGVVLDSFIAAARFITKKVGVGLTVAILLRDVGGCFGWWHF